MLVARLFIGAISSLCAGFVASWITNRSVLMMKSLAGLLVIILLPVITLWERFPPWYHVVFLTSLPLLTLVGAWLYPRRRNRHRSMNSA
jgi:fructose-specific phosphotransferase system IIC component